MPTPRREPDDRSESRAAFAIIAGEGGLVERVRAGDAGAFEALVRAYIVPLTKFAIRYLGSEDEARDVVQEVFCAIWIHRTDWRPTRSLDRYLFGAVRNRVFNRERHARVVREHAVAARDDVDGPDVAPEDERTELVRREMQNLTERQRSAIALRYAGGRTVAEVAAILGMSAKGAEKLLARSLRALREALRRP